MNRTWQLWRRKGKRVLIVTAATVVVGLGQLDDRASDALGDDLLSEEDATDEFNERVADVYMVACDPAYQDWDLGPVTAGVYACYGLQTNLDDETRVVVALVYEQDGQIVVDELDPSSADSDMLFPTGESVSEQDSESLDEDGSFPDGAVAVVTTGP